MRPGLAPIVLALALSSGCASAGHRASVNELHQRRQLGALCVPSPAPEHFAFRSAFWLNLHNFLLREAKLRRGIRDESLGALGVVEPDTLGSRPLTPQERQAWDEASSLYVRLEGGMALPDSVVARVNDRLAGSGDTPDVEWPGQDEAIRRALLAVAPIYRAVWWPQHDRWNREWIRRATERLDRFEGCLAPRLAAQLGSRWPAAPIRVDATVYATWFGAYTTLDPPHITLSTTAVANQDDGALEALLHEAGHTMLGAVHDSLDAAGVADPDELSHLILFYTAGDLVRRVIPGFPTNAVRFRIWDQNPRARRIRGLLSREWLPWLDGERTLSEALRAVARGARPSR